jgi:hypothetical protein
VDTSKATSLSTNTRPRVLIYKRTHIGDPNLAGEFGCSDCMGRVRGFAYDAVIGIGGSSYEPRSHGIDGRITWVGIGPRRQTSSFSRGAPIVTFERFAIFDSVGEKLRDFAPALAEHFFMKHRRFFFSDSLSDEIQRDIERILQLAKLDKPPKFRGGTKRASGCRPHCPPPDTQVGGSVLSAHGIGAVSRCSV